MLLVVPRISTMSRIRILFAWLVLAALPLQGFAAATMLFCGLGEGPAAQVAVVASSHEDHAAHGHVHVAKAKSNKSGEGKQQLPDPSHKCGACAACCPGAAVASTARVLAVADLPQAEAADPFVRIDPLPSTVPDKPPRA
jgi:hypothetical protein